MIDKVKLHVKNHKTAYMVGGALIAGVVVGVVFTKHVKAGDVIVVEGVNNIGKDMSVNKTIVNFVENSTPSKPVHLVGTNLYFNSIREAARVTGHQVSMISKNVNGHIADVKGDVFELLELAE